MNKQELEQITLTLFNKRLDDRGVNAQIAELCCTTQRCVIMWKMRDSVPDGYALFLRLYVKVRGVTDPPSGEGE